jgi:signal peptide peptidase SppA
MKYAHIVNEIFRKPWAILPEKLHVMAELVALRASGEKFTEEEIRLRIGAQSIEAAKGRGGTSYGSVAVIQVYGVISQRMSLMAEISGGTSAEQLTKQLRAALADPNIGSIVLDVDSPGGGVEGVPELAAEILDARGKKKIIAVANTMAASAAYWLASCASELVVAPSGQVGSIGVFTAHEDMSQALEKEGIKVSMISAGKFKTEGNPYEPLSDEARAALQMKVTAFYEMFVKAVAKGRGVAQADVKGGFGQGRMLLAQDAVKEGMADRVATLDQTLSRLGVKSASSGTGAEDGAPAIAASDVPDADPLADLRRRERQLDLH